MFFFFFFKQKTAYEWRISDWSSDVCSSDLDKDTSCVVVQYPDILGRIDDMTKLAEACQAAGALLIAVVTEPVALGLSTHRERRLVLTEGARQHEQQIGRASGRERVGEYV